MANIFKRELENFNKTDLQLYKVVTAKEVEWANRSWDSNLTDDEYEIVCGFIYDWFTETSASVQEICDNFFNEFSAGKFKIQDIIDDYDKVEKIMNDSF